MRLAALWHPKARQWINGRKNLFAQIHSKFNGLNETAWFHFASLGEFEQGRPVMEALKKAKPDTKLVVTFFSPSGYEIRKNYALAEAVFYLPLDTPANAAEFIRLINPKIAVFTKYEYWFFFFRALSRKQIPLYIISGIFRKNQVFFKRYGSLHRQMLGFVTYFFVQNAESKHLLGGLNIKNVSISGDTRFDRVAELAQNPKDLPDIKAFCGDSKVFIAGSTWPQDEQLLVELIQNYPDWKFIIAPHEVAEANIQSLCKLLPTNSWLRLSELKVESQKLKVKNGEREAESVGIQNLKSEIVHLKSENSIINTQYSILVIDNIGLLSSLYAFADVAYIGGGFGSGIHNTLEAAAFGLPVIFGPKYEKFQEAKDLIEKGAAFSIHSQASLNQVMVQLEQEKFRENAGENALKYVQANTGATRLILQKILQNNS